jgi:hypothetical protein
MKISFLMDGCVGTDDIPYGMSYERAMPNGEQAAPANPPEMYANKNRQENRFAAAKGAAVSGKETLLTLLTKRRSERSSERRVHKIGGDQSVSFCMAGT